MSVSRSRWFAFSTESTGRPRRSSGISATGVGIRSSNTGKSMAGGVVTPMRLEKESRDLLLEKGKVVLHDIPDDLDRDAEVVVDDPVPHPGHALPRDVGVCGAGARRDLLGGLADDLKVANDSVLGFQILAEGGLAGGRERENSGNRLVDVPEIDEIILHSGTASAKTLARRNGLRPSSVTTSTRRPRAASTSSQKPIRSANPRPFSRWMRRSTSLCGEASPRATEPNTRTLPAPWAFAARRISGRLALR